MPFMKNEVFISNFYFFYLFIETPERVNILIELL